MYSAENHLWGWVGYGLGVTLLLLAVWGATRWLRWSWLRHGLLIVLAAVLLTPMQPYADAWFLAPAIFVSVFEGMSTVSEGGLMRGMPAISVVLLAMLVLYSLVALLWQRVRRTGISGDPPAADERVPAGGRLQS